MHLQETNITEASFHFCPSINQNYKIIHQNNSSGFGVCSLIHKRLTISNEMAHPEGRLIMFDIGQVSLINLYLPSGQETEAKHARENYISTVIPNYLLNSQKMGIMGGDFNCLDRKEDASHLAENKISQNLQNLTRIKKLKDTFRQMHPSSRSYSHFYNWNSGGTLRQGASRIDRSYAWGGLKILKASYLSTAYSDHFLHLVKINTPTPSQNRNKTFKPYYKMSKEILEELEFKEIIRNTVMARERSRFILPLDQWWEALKSDIRREAKQYEYVKRKKRKARLTFLMMAQQHLSGKVGQGELHLLAELKKIQMEICEWFDVNAKKVITHGRISDAQDSEKVRIYHHEKMHRSFDKSTIDKLQLDDKIINGHEECAKHLDNEVRKLLGRPAKLDKKAQQELLDGIGVVFTKEDNQMLEAPVTDEEIKKSLLSANQKAAPGSDGIPYAFYTKFWSLIGHHLCAVVKSVISSGSPTSSMATSFMVFSPKPGKSSSIRPKDKRKISMLQADFKVVTGVLAARLRKTDSHTLSPRQYAVGDKKITHGINMFRDAIHNLPANGRGAAVVETDFQQAYDLLAVSWTWLVLEAKGCSPSFVSTMRRIYEESPDYVITIINNEQQKKILNLRNSIKQGCRGSTELFTHSIDPVLAKLDRNLAGICYHKMATEGPKHPVLGPPLAVETRLKLIGFVDDIKAILRSIEEFKLLDGTISLFEKSSGSRLHRDPATKKCQLLALGRWGLWKQRNSPLDYMLVVQELNILGVKMTRSALSSRNANGDDLVKRVRDTINGFKAGRFLPLVSKPWVANCYIMSKISYRSSAYNLRQGDLNKIQSATKSWVTQGLLLKPAELLLYRSPEEGGLGLVQASARCQANLIKSFVSQGHPRSAHSNSYLSTLFRCHVTQELPEDLLKKPPYFGGTFFPIIRETWQQQDGEILHISTRQWQSIILEKGVTHVPDPQGPPMLIPTEQEKRSPDTDWKTSWDLMRTQGLSPSQKSTLFCLVQDLIVNNERLLKLRKREDSKCSLCWEAPDNKAHLFLCSSYSSTVKGVKLLLDEATGTNFNTIKLTEFDIQVKEDHLRLPLAFLLVEITKHLIAQKAAGKKEDTVTMSSNILAKAHFLQLIPKYEDSFSTIRRWLLNFFDLPTQPHDPLVLRRGQPAPLAISAQSKGGVERGILGSPQSRNLISSYFHVTRLQLTMNPRGKQADLGQSSAQPAERAESVSTSPASEQTSATLHVRIAGKEQSQPPRSSLNSHVQEAGAGSDHGR